MEKYLSEKIKWFKSKWSNPDNLDYSEEIFEDMIQKDNFVYDVVELLRDILNK